MVLSRTRLVAMAATLAILAVPLSGAGVAAKHENVIEFTVIPLVPGQPLGNPLAAAHLNKKTGLFRVGKAASPGLEQMAEGGQVDLLSQEVTGNEQRYPAQGPGYGPSVAGGVPGAAVTPSVMRWQIWIPASVPFVSVVAQLMCTNDGFAAASNVRVPRKKGQAQVVDLGAFDAGTEMNTEVSTDIMPVCAEFANAGKTPGTPEPQPELDENGTVEPHPGIAGIADLDPEVHGWEGPVGLLIVRNIGKAPHGG